MYYFRLSRVLKTAYAQFARMSWAAVVFLVSVHYFVSYAGIRAFESGEIVEWIAFTYFYVTTVMTVGYGDLAAKTAGGRLVALLWMMPVGVMLFTACIAKFVQFIANGWRRRMRGEGDYSFLEDHVVILGWQGLRTQRMIEEILGDVGAASREIVLCTTKDIENPMPTAVKFVRDKALSEANLHRRAGTRGAEVIIALGHDDNDTLAASLAAASANPQAHLVAYFEQQSFANLLSAHCPSAEVLVSLNVEMLVRAAQDPGSSRVQSDLVSVFEGQTQFSLRVPELSPVVRYGRLLTVLKERHGATLIAMARDTRAGSLRLNAPADAEVVPGTVLYYIAAARLEPGGVDWGAAA
jgi:voltage-gated potassium channel